MATKQMKSKNKLLPPYSNGGNTQKNEPAKQAKTLS